MPSFPPRKQPIKKRDQLYQKYMELKKAVRSNLSDERLHKIVEKYRSAQLSLLKAVIHEIQEKQFQNKIHNLEISKIECQIIFWTNRRTEEIISDIRSEM